MTLIRPNWMTLKWTTPKNNNPNEYYLMFLAASVIKLHITSAYVHPVQPLATSLSNCTWNKQLSFIHFISLIYFVKSLIRLHCFYSHPSCLIGRLSAIPLESAMKPWNVRHGTFMVMLVGEHVSSWSISALDHGVTSTLMTSKAT